ncbi:iron donor protein CyaY, partial [Vibrio cholerae]|nr:iron donor protein CyaY [Vibrio cholerae]
HFNFVDQEWICDRSGAEFWDFMSVACTRQAEEEVELR